MDELADGEALPPPVPVGLSEPDRPLEPEGLTEPEKLTEPDGWKDPDGPAE